MANTSESLGTQAGNSQDNKGPVPAKTREYRERERDWKVPKFLKLPEESKLGKVIQTESEAQ